MSRKRVLLSALIVVGCFIVPLDAGMVIKCNRYATSSSVDPSSLPQEGDSTAVYSSGSCSVIIALNTNTKGYFILARPSTTFAYADTCDFYEFEGSVTLSDKTSKSAPFNKQLQCYCSTDKCNNKQWYEKMIKFYPDFKAAYDTLLATPTTGTSKSPGSMKCFYSGNIGALSRSVPSSGGSCTYAVDYSKLAGSITDTQNYQLNDVYDVHFNEKYYYPDFCFFEDSASQFSMRCFCNQKANCNQDLPYLVLIYQKYLPYLDISTANQGYQSTEMTLSCLNKLQNGDSILCTESCIVSTHVFQKGSEISRATVAGCAKKLVSIEYCETEFNGTAGKENLIGTIDCYCTSENCNSPEFIDKVRSLDSFPQAKDTTMTNMYDGDKLLDGKSVLYAPTLVTMLLMFIGAVF